jgi:hypothetical protein
MKTQLNKLINNMNGEAIKFFKRMIAVGTGMLIIGMFVMGFVLIISAVIQGGVASILLAIFGVALVHWSSKAIDNVIKEVMLERQYEGVDNKLIVRKKKKK